MSPMLDPTGELFRLAFELSPTGLLAVNEGGTILLANREARRLFGWDETELLGRSIEDLLPERFGAGHPHHRSTYFRAPSARPMGAGRDLYARHRDGTEFLVEIGLNPVQGPAGTIVLASVVDIRARRQAEQRLRQSQKLEAIGTLAGGIAHDFNNILLGIVGHTELAQRELEPGSTAHADLDQVLRASERGRQLVRRILAFSRKDDSERIATRLDRSVREALQLLRASLPVSVSIRELLDPAAPEVLADETQIHQVVMNLCTNAAHAMPEGGQLEVRLEAVDLTAPAGRLATLSPGRYVRLTVRDEGVGMSPDVLERVFEPFFTTREPGRGTGLGLSVIHGIVEAHGGGIEIDSTPGRGTRVEVLLPAVTAAAPARDAAAAPAAGKHVLLVDDEESLLLMMSRQLRSRGFRVTAMPSAVDAWEEFQRHPQAFDLVISDNSMPRMTGLELAARIRAAHPTLPILLVSGFAQSADAETLRAHGVTHVLGKPHTGRELDEAIERVLAGK